MSRRWRALATLVVLLVAMVFIAKNPVLGNGQPIVNLGLDLKGGLRVMLQVIDPVLARVPDTVTSEQVKQVVAGLNLSGLVISEQQATEGSERHFLIRARGMDEAKRQEVRATLAAIAGGDVTVEPFIQDAERRATDLEQARRVITSRVNEIGVTEPLIQVAGVNRILVELPGIQDRERALTLIGQQAQLEFRLVKRESINQRAADMTLDDLGEVLLTGDQLQNASFTAFDTQYNSPTVQLSFNRDGAEKFAEITGANVGQRLAIVLDGKVQTAPEIQTEITGGNAVINGVPTVAEARDIALVLRTGSLPVSLETVEIRSVGPTLGADSIRSGITASIVGAAAVFIFMFVYYGLYMGLAAAVGLLFTMTVILGALAGLGATLTLPGIAGLVLTIGMAVDGNVISFERVREEIRNGKTLKAALRAGIDRSLATILDANITTLFAALALYQFTTGPVRGFAVTLSLGIVVAVFSNLIVAPLLLHALIGVGRLTRSVIGQPKIAFIAAAPVVGGTTGILATLGLAFVLYLSLTGGLNLGIDFTGGTSILLLAPDNVRVEDVRGALASAGVGGAVVQRLVDPTKPQNLISVRAKELTSQDTLNAALRALQALGTPPVQSTGETTDQPASSVTILQTDSVGPAVGADLRRETSLAILVALVLILIYVGWRFEPIFGIAAVIALVHDVSITDGFLAVTGREFTIPIVAALLTIIGYSLNDSIIVADRIREMTKLHRKQAYPEVVDMAINMTLSRTVMTTFTTLLPVTSLLILGGPVLRDFSIAMVTGLLVGTFSSVYIMSPVVVWWKLRNPKVRRLSQQAARA